MSLIDETTNPHRDTPMDVTETPQLDENIPNLSTLTLSDREEASSLASIDKIVKDENDIRLISEL